MQVTPARLSIATGGIVSQAGKALLEGAGKLACKLLSTGCFLAGTLVTTPDGLTPIEQLDVGARVYSSELGRDESANDLAISMMGTSLSDSGARIASGRAYSAVTSTGGGSELA